MDFYDFVCCMFIIIGVIYMISSVMIKRDTLREIKNLTTTYRHDVASKRAHGKAQTEFVNCVMKDYEEIMTYTKRMMKETLDYVDKMKDDD